jgi:hypothetical protein
MPLQSQCAPCLLGESLKGQETSNVFRWIPVCPGVTAINSQIESLVLVSYSLLAHLPYFATRAGFGPTGRAPLSENIGRTAVRATQTKMLAAYQFPGRAAHPVKTLLSLTRSG